MDWIIEARKTFAAKRPEHFTDFEHCPECLEHEKTLQKCSIDKIGIDELGNPGWDPLCFCSAEGIGYFFPALVRLSLDTAVNQEFYFDQLLFHLSYDGARNDFLQYCSSHQKAFIARFIEYMITTYSKEIEENMCMSDALNTYELWNSAFTPAGRWTR